MSESKLTTASTLVFMFFLLTLLKTRRVDAIFVKIVGKGSEERDWIANGAAMDDDRAHVAVLRLADSKTEGAAGPESCWYGLEHRRNCSKSNRRRPGARLLHSPWW